MEIKDPATGEVIGRVAPGDVAAAVDTAAKAQPGWAALDDQERCAALMRAADAIDTHAEELAYVVSREQGKTMNGLGARYEAAGCASSTRATRGWPTGRPGAAGLHAAPDAPRRAGGPQFHAAGALGDGLEPHTEADVARTMNATLGFLAAATA